MENNMIAIGITEGLPVSNPNCFQSINLPIPIPGKRDILVKITGISINPVDTKQRISQLKVATPRILGYDAVGEVVKVGADVALFQPGDQVFYAGSVKRQGSYAEYQLVDERIAGFAPREIPLEQLAVLPLTSLTAYEALFEKLRFIPEIGSNYGKQLLIINGAGGVGSIAIQLAKWAGIKVITTASRPETSRWVKKMGADVVINHQQSLATQLMALGINAVDAVLILHSTDDYFEEAAQLIAPLGHVASIVGTQKPVNLELLKDKSASFDWEFMFSKSSFQVEMESQHLILDKIGNLLVAKQLISTHTRTLHGLSVETIRKGHELIESNKMIGKLAIIF